jgi:hypothetical protein
MNTLMKGVSNVQDLWIETGMRCWLFYMRAWFPLSMAFLPSPTEDKGLREAFNILRKRIDGHEQRLIKEGL